jgi:hypothetical protein
MRPTATGYLDESADDAATEIERCLTRAGVRPEPHLLSDCMRQFGYDLRSPRVRDAIIAHARVAPTEAT